MNQARGETKHAYLIAHGRTLYACTEFTNKMPFNGVPPPNNRKKEEIQSRLSERVACVVAIKHKGNTIRSAGHQLCVFVHLIHSAFVYIQH